MSLGHGGLLVIVGLAVLAGGGELLVRGAVAIARTLGLTTAVIGLTIVAMGTSLPELAVSVTAGLRGEPDIAIGNVVGSNIFNITFIAGLSALAGTLPIRGNVIKLEWPAMFLASLAFAVAARDGVLDRFEASAFLLAMLLFTAYSIRIARIEAAPLDLQQLRRQAEERSLRASSRRLAGPLAAVVAGLALLVVGGRVLVDGAVGVAQRVGISQRVIGLTVVAAGTSAPELATSIIAAFRRESEIAIANLIGSNIFNILGILGLAGILTPLSISPAILRHDLWWLLGTAAFLFPLMRAGMGLSRRDGLVLSLTYAAYVALLLRNPV